MNNDNETKVNAPDEDLDASSKVSIWTHIYYRMNLAYSDDEIPHQENGQIKIGDLRKFTMKVIDIWVTADGLTEFLISRFHLVN